MYNINELINLTLNSIEYEGLKTTDVLMWLLDMGTTFETADEVVSAVNFEITLGVQ
jgi:hypothetical protein